MKKCTVMFGCILKYSLLFVPIITIHCTVNVIRIIMACKDKFKASNV